MNTLRSVNEIPSARSRWVCSPTVVSRGKASPGRFGGATCRAAGRSGTGSSRRDVPSVNSSAVEVRVREVEVGQEGQEGGAPVDEGMDAEVGGMSRPGESCGVVLEDTVDVEDRSASYVSASSSEASYTTSRSCPSFTSINDAEHQLKFLIPNALSGCIIGKKGSNLERIQAQSGAFIQANAAGFAVQSHRHRFIIIAGDSMDRCLHGLTLLLRSVEEADKLHLLKANVQEEEDPRLYLRQIIPGSCAGNIIGVKGGNVARISRERGLSVFVEAKPMHAAKVPFRIVSYAGSSVDQLVGGVRGVIDELQLVDSYMEQYAAEIKDIKSVVIKVLRIPSGRVGALIGPKGAHLQALQDVLKCRLTLRKSSDVDEEDGAGYDSGDAVAHYLTVWGQPDNVRAAVAVARLQGGYEVKRQSKESKFSKESKESRASG